MRAEDVRKTQHIKAFPHRKTPSCTADTDCLTTWCLFGVSTFKTVDNERSRYTFLSATKPCNTALSVILDYLMVAMNYCLKRKTYSPSTARANCCLPSCPRWRRRKADLFPRTSHGDSGSAFLTARSASVTRSFSALKRARMGK